MTRKLLILCAVMLAVAALVPITFSQDAGLGVAVSDLKDRVSALEKLPEIVIKIQAELDEMIWMMKILGAAVFTFFAKRALSTWFGIEVTRKDKTQ